MEVMGDVGQNNLSGVVGDRLTAVRIRENGKREI